MGLYDQAGRRCYYLGCVMKALHVCSLYSLREFLLWLNWFNMSLCWIQLICINKFLQLSSMMLSVINWRLLVEYIDRSLYRVVLPTETVVDLQFRFAWRLIRYETIDSTMFFFVVLKKNDKLVCRSLLDILKAEDWLCLFEGANGLVYCVLLFCGVMHCILGRLDWPIDFYILNLPVCFF